MTRLVLSLAAVLLLTSSAVARDGGDWRMVCDHDATAQEPLCHVSTFIQDERNGHWLGIAVQVLNGSHEVQVTSSGSAYHSAEIDGATDLTTYTDYCYGSYCVFVHAENLVERFKARNGVQIRLYNGATTPLIEKRVSLIGFTKAYEEYLDQIGE